MSIPLIYNLRSLRQRPISTLATAMGMALVVAVFVAMNAMSNGFRATLIETGSTDNMFLVRKGSNAELNSSLSREVVRTVSGLSYVAKDTDGLPLISPETFVVITLERANQGGNANVVVRGVGAKAFLVRQNVKITEGRNFIAGTREIVVGTGWASRFPHSAIGDSVEFGKSYWKIVGHFSAGGSSFESEIWGDNEQFMPVFRGEVFQSITFRMADPSAYAGIKENLEKDVRLAVDAKDERQFYTDQSTQLGDIINFIGTFLAVIMAFGAVFGAVNTMYAAVASRGPEIGVLLTLGFRPLSVMTSFLIESVMISVIGGIIGCIIVLPINGMLTSTTNWNSFSEIAFAFKITPELLIKGMIFAIVMGVLGGLLPARRAAKQQVVDALREA